MKRISLLCLALVLSACTSTKPAAPVVVAPIEQGTSAPNQTATISTIVDPVIAAQEAQRAAREQQIEALTKQSIYFDFDSFVVKAPEQTKVSTHAKFMQDAKLSPIQVQGNTDTQGSREYNLALGQKRANAVVKALELLGVPSTWLEAVSFGMEKPQALGQDEASHAQNRRVDIAYPK